MATSKVEEASDSLTVLRGLAVGEAVEKREVISSAQSRSSELLALAEE